MGNGKKSAEMKRLRDKVAVVGIGETAYLQSSGRKPKDLIIEAINKALNDAKLTPADIDGMIGGFEGPQIFSYRDLAYNLGIKYRFHGDMGDFSGSNTSSFHLAAMAISSGMADVVLTYCATTYGSLMKKILDGEVKEKDGEAAVNVVPMGIKGSFEVPYGSNMPGIFFAEMANRYMHEYGLTRDQLNRYLGAIVINQRNNAILNGKGVIKKQLTYEDYLNSPVIVDPLKRDDCYAISDGACAWIITSAERARHCPRVPVYVTGMGYGCTPMGSADAFTQEAGDYLYKPHEIFSLDQALGMADITREDLDFAEIYDSYSIQLLLSLESLGFCNKGEGGPFAESGTISLSGSLPVNTHGGHLSHCELYGATHVVEAIRQLRGEAGACQVNNAKLGMVSAGTAWENYVTILRRN
jgi:acetyl-CoA acetyltransferase